MFQCYFRTGFRFPTARTGKKDGHKGVKLKSSSDIRQRQWTDGIVFERVDTDRFFSTWSQNSLPRILFHHHVLEQFQNRSIDFSTLRYNQLFLYWVITKILINDFFSLSLNRKEMVTATNSILTGLAVADMLVMVDYIPYTIHNYVQELSIKETFTYGWAIFALFHAHFSVICHTISTWLTVLLAVWRYIAVK